MTQFTCWETLASGVEDAPAADGADAGEENENTADSDEEENVDEFADDDVSSV